MEGDVNTPQCEMPRYKSHKSVWALKIAKVELLPNPDTTGQTAASHYGCTLTPEDPGYAPFKVDSSYQAKHKPEPGGYYVVYADGYKSFSPAKAFEEGNTLIDGTENSSDAKIEQAIQAAGKTGPRITPAALASVIVSEHYFTAKEGVLGMLAADGVPPTIYEQANAAPAALGLLTLCVLVLRNGFTVTGESACASPANFDADIGQEIARENAMRKIWPLLGYQLKEQLFQGTRPGE